MTIENIKSKREDFKVSGKKISLTFTDKKILADQEKLNKLWSY